MENSNKNKKMFIKGARNGNVFWVQRMMNEVEPLYVHQALEIAATNGHIQCLELLLQVTGSDENSKECVNQALTNAAYKGHAKCIELLLPVSDPKYKSSFALEMAATEGHLECVKILLPVSDPKSSDSNALLGAAKNRHCACVDALIEFSDAQMVINVMKNDYPEDPTCWHYVEQKFAQLQHDRLNAHIEQNRNSIPSVRKI